MHSIPVVAFNFCSRYGHFRKPYSTVSSFSYPFPPRTAIAGLLGAILGVKKEEVPEVFSAEKAKIGISLNKQIETITHVANFRQTSSGDIGYSVKVPKNVKKAKPSKGIPDSSKVAIIPMEILKCPSYLIYVSLDDFMDELISRLKTERHFYTPCMGLSEFLAQVGYVSEGYAQVTETKEIEISTVVSKDDCTLWIDKLNKFTKNNIQELKAPYLNTPDRIFDYKTYLVDLTSNPIPVKMKSSCYQFESKHITFL